MSITADQLTALSDDDWRSLVALVQAEGARRDTLASSVSQVTQITQTYVAAGGDSAALVTAVTDASKEPTA